MITTTGGFKIQKGLNNPILRQISKTVETIDEKIVNFSNNLIKMMWDYDGVGLAAPQIGENIRIAAITEWEIKNKKWKLIKQHILINPELLEKSEKMEIDEEGCISLPGIKGLVSRHYEIKIKYIDLNGEIIIKKFTGINSRIIQHEMDHLNGVLFVDKIIKKITPNLKKLININ